ncbi:hypothetical protein K439DRAFT_246625 [Ramaria rubella]|nr:hypothetical protein K439DRAFT_246625 [Ramaria rubella]
MGFGQLLCKFLLSSPMFLQIMPKPSSFAFSSNGISLTFLARQVEAANTWFWLENLLLIGNIGNRRVTNWHCG